MAAGDDPFLQELTAQVRARYPLLYLLSSEEERLERKMAKVAEAAGVHLIRWNSAAGFAVIHAAGGKAPVAPAQVTDPLGALAEIRRGPERVLYLLEDLHAYFDRPEMVRALREAIRTLPRQHITLAIVAPSLRMPPELEKEISVRELPYPDATELAAVLARAVESFPEGRRPDPTATLREKMCNAAAGLTENEARRLFTKALLLKPQFSADDLTLLLAEKKQIIRQSEMLEFFESSEGMNSIGGLDELKNWLATREKAFGEEARQYGLPQPKGLLLLGVQGCGKSLTAKAIANLWNLPLLRLDFGAVFSAGSAGPDENLRRALQISESVAPAVLWVDEVEKGLAGLGGQNAASAATARVLGSLITWMQEKKSSVFVVATANSIEYLPAELLRKGRFDEIFFVDLPDPHEREKIFEIHLTRRNRDPKAFPCKDLAAAAEKFSGAEIEEAIVSGLYEAFAQGRELAAEDIRQAIRETVPLAVTQEEQIQALKDWARERARRASLDTRMLDVFGQGAKR